MKKGDIVELTIEKYAFEGKGIAKIDLTDKTKKFVVFVNYAYPGDIVKAQIIKRKNEYAEARIIEIISPSKERGKPLCKYFGICGGCKHQDLDYHYQIKYKQEQVKEIFEKLGKFIDILIEDIVPSEKKFFYRNKMEFSFSEKKWLTKEQLETHKNYNNNFALGLHIPKIIDKVLDIDECFLQSEQSNSILNFTRNFFKERNVSIYSFKTNSGYLRNLVIRHSSKTNEIMVNLVTFYEDENLMIEYVNTLINNFPFITTIVNNINTKKAMVAIGEYEKIFYGNGNIYDFIGKYKFRISPNSFFQTNTNQAEKLYQIVLKYAELKGNEIVYDLYAGAGTISIFISAHCKKVFAFENVESAIIDAEENKKINNINNVKFILADLYKSIIPLVEKENLPKPDLIILDPPRSGLHKNTIDDVIKLNPGKIVYVSCNPTTQVRDIKMFVDSNYKLMKMKPVDMFPHTYHIENVALLESMIDN